jgi:hypothetical protein
VASLVCAIASLFCGVGSVLGIVFGFVARNQIRRSNGAETGSGLALAGIIVGFCYIGIVVLVVLLILLVTPSSSNSG